MGEDKFLVSGEVIPLLLRSEVLGDVKELEWVEMKGGEGLPPDNTSSTSWCTTGVSGEELATLYTGLESVLGEERVVADTANAESWPGVTLSGFCRATSVLVTLTGNAT